MASVTAETTAFNSQHQYSSAFLSPKRQQVPQPKDGKLIT
jgi:hypothetical protein